MTSFQKQRGNTLTGIIIGLVIGLAVAVVVALVITKGSTPFTDKSGKLGKPAELPNGQLADPNKPLYGKNDAARDANKDFQKEDKAPAPAAAPATPAAPAAPDPIAQIAAGAKPAAVVAAQAPAKAPAAAPAPATPAAPAAAAAADDKYVYFLQAGAFRDMPDAENAKAKLALLGYEAVISDRSSDSGVLHRVRLGPFNQVEAMNKVRAKLSEAGVDVAVVRNQK